MSKTKKKTSKSTYIKPQELATANPNLLAPYFGVGLFVELLLLFLRANILNDSGNGFRIFAFILMGLGVAAIIAGIVLLAMKKWDKTKNIYLLVGGVLLAFSAGFPAFFADQALVALEVFPFVVLYVLLAMYLKRDFFYELLVLGLSVGALYLYYRSFSMEALSSTSAYSIFAFMLVMALLTQMVSMAQKNNGVFKLGKIMFTMLSQDTDYRLFYIVTVASAVVIIVAMLKSVFTLYALIFEAVLLVALLVYRSIRYKKKVLDKGKNKK